MNRASGVISVYQWTDLFIYTFKKKKRSESLLSPLQLCLGALFSGEVVNCVIFQSLTTNSCSINHNSKMSDWFFLMYKNKQSPCKKNPNWTGNNAANITQLMQIQGKCASKLIRPVCLREDYGTRLTIIYQAVILSAVATQKTSA